MKNKKYLRIILVIIVLSILTLSLFGCDSMRLRYESLVKVMTRAGYYDKEVDIEMTPLGSIMSTIYKDKAPEKIQSFRDSLERIIKFDGYTDKSGEIGYVYYFKKGKIADEALSIFKDNKGENFTPYKDGNVVVYATRKALSDIRGY